MNRSNAINLAFSHQSAKIVPTQHSSSSSTTHNPQPSNPSSPQPPTILPTHYFNTSSRLPPKLSVKSTPTSCTKANIRHMSVTCPHETTPASHPSIVSLSLQSHYPPNPWSLDTKMVLVICHIDWALGWSRIKPLCGEEFSLWSATHHHVFQTPPTFPHFTPIIDCSGLIIDCHLSPPGLYNGDAYHYGNEGPDDDEVMGRVYQGSPTTTSAHSLASPISPYHSIFHFATRETWF